MALHGFTQWPFFLVLAAFLIQTYIYLFNPALAGRIKGALKPLWTVLDRKYWVDDVYFAVFARGGVKLGRMFWKAGDAAVIDGVLVNGSARLIGMTAALVRQLQTGFIYYYALAMIAGVVVFMWMFIPGKLLSGWFIR